MGMSGSYLRHVIVDAEWMKVQVPWMGFYCIEGSLKFFEQVTQYILQN